MPHFNSKIDLPVVVSIEELEKLRLTKDIFERLAKEIIAFHNLADEPLISFEGTNIVFSFGKNHVLKIYPPCHQNDFNKEVLVLQYLKKKLSVKTPEIEYEGSISGWPYIIMTRLDGILLEDVWGKMNENNKTIIIREIGALIKETHSLPVSELAPLDCHWAQFISHQINKCVVQHQATHLPEELIKLIPSYLNNSEKFLPKIRKSVLLTGEYTPMNLLVKQEAGIWHIHGMFDFGDSMLGSPEYDLLGPGTFLIQGNKKLLREFLLAYGYAPKELSSSLSRQLTTLMLLHRYSNLNVQIRIKNWKDRARNISDIEELVWGL